MVLRSQYAMAACFRTQIVEADCSDDHREWAARTARRMADRCKRRDATFSYEWFFGACGLDSWGELPPPSYTRRWRVKSDPGSND